MKKKRSFLLGLITIVAIFFLGGPAHAITIGFAPVSQNVLLGDSVAVDLVISGLGDGGPDSLGAFDLIVEYDIDILQFSGYQLGTYLGDLSLLEAEDYSLGEMDAGSVNIAELSFLVPNATDDVGQWGPPYLDVIQPSTFTMATLTFDTIATGTSLLNYSAPPFAFLVLGDAYGNELFSETTFESGEIIVVAPVPEPATLLLLGTGLVGMATTLRRKKTK